MVSTSAADAGLSAGLSAAARAGSDNTVTLDQAQVRTPSDPGYVPTAPPDLSTAAALSLLQAAGYKVEKNTPPSTVPAPGGARSVEITAVRFR